MAPEPVAPAPFRTIPELIRGHARARPQLAALELGD
jgi:hypothetical protein